MLAAAAVIVNACQVLVSTAGGSAETAAIRKLLASRYGKDIRAAIVEA